MISTLISKPRPLSALLPSKLRYRNMSSATKKVAVVLSGNGVFDGTECTEGVATLVHLSRNGVEYNCYAPDMEQMHALDHTTGSEHATNRNVLQESARIARGNVQPLSKLVASSYHALIIPGGFGAAKNLSSWAVDGPQASVQPDVARVIRDFHDSDKVIGACCIAPTLLALTLKKDIEITVGMAEGDKWPYAGTANQLADLGAVHKPCSIEEIAVDSKNKLVTAPAYMYDGKPHEVYDSVGKMVDAVLNLTK